MKSLQQEEKTKEPQAGGRCNIRNHEDSKPSATLTAYDRYSALRNHRIRFEDALDPNAERVTALRKDDVIFGRGKNMQDYPGNRKMRSIINKYKQEYHAVHRSEKRDLIESVYMEIVQGGARFLTKSPNDEHFVVVDVEIALQKVGNTLRCRKSWNKVARPESVYEEKLCASSTVRQNRVIDLATSPAARISRNQAIRSASHIPPLIVRNRSQTMLLLRENTLRLMKKMPLLPVTLNDMCYLRRCQSLQPCLGQRSSASPQMQVNAAVSGSQPVGLPKMACSMGRGSTLQFSETVVDSVITCRK